MALNGFTKDRLSVQIFPTREEMGKQAAADISRCIRGLLGEQEEVNIIFAAAPSQMEMLECLTADSAIDFGRINAFHMDEYIGIDPEAPQGFGNFLRRHLFDKAPFRSVHLINGLAKDAAVECERYAALLRAHPADIVCMGLGENAHIAFNDPGLANFDDPELVKAVPLAEESRVQQVNDGCFAQLDEVPTHAITLTIPALMAGKRHFCVVPAKTKAQAVYDTLHEPISADCPGTALRRAADAVLYLDADSASLLPEGR